MRNSLFLTLSVITLAFTGTAVADPVPFDVMVSAHALSCVDAVTNLREKVANGVDTYTAEQTQTRQFESGPAALKFCQVARAAPAPFAYIANVTNSGLFPLPTENVNIANHPCSTELVNGVTQFGVGWSGSSTCIEP